VLDIYYLDHDNERRHGSLEFEADERELGKDFQLLSGIGQLASGFRHHSAQLQKEKSKRRLTPQENWES